MLIEKEEEINRLKKLESQKQDIINKNLNVVRSYIRTVLIECVDPSIKYAIPCLSFDRFSDIEKILYRDFSDLLNNRNKYYFLKNGRIIQSSDVIDQFHIGDGRPVNMQCINLSNSMVSAGYSNRPNI